MPYIQRDAQGKISALTAEPAPAGEFLPLEHPEVIGFLAAQPEGGMGNGQNVDLLLADLKMIRVIEDIIDLLIAKNVIIFSELPVPVQEKILKKRGQREKLFGSGADLIGMEEGIL